MTEAAEMTEDTDREPTAGPDSVEARLRALRADVELLDQVVRDFLEPAADAAPPGPAGPRFEPCYPSVEAWVVGQFAPTYARPLSPAVRWCARWWDHAEAISRLEALWRVWEVARLDVVPPPGAPADGGAERPGVGGGELADDPGLHRGVARLEPWAGRSGRCGGGGGLEEVAHHLVEQLDVGAQGAQPGLDAVLTGGRLAAGVRGRV